MIKPLFIASALILALGMESSLAVNEVPGLPPKSALAIWSVTVQGKTQRPNPATELNLGESPKNVVFSFGPLPTNRAPMRLRYKLEGHDTSWHEGAGEMYLAVRFSDDA